MNIIINALQKRLSLTEESKKRQGKQKAAWLKVKFVPPAMGNIPFNGIFNCKEALELAAGSTEPLTRMKVSRRLNTTLRDILCDHATESRFLPKTDFEIG